MRRTRLALLAAVVSVVPFAAVAGAEEPAAPASPEAIVEYYEGPAKEFDADVKAVAARATRSLKSQLKKKPKKPAIVFDIDDTLESTYRCAKASNFDRAAIARCQVRGEQDPIKPVWRLLKYAQRRKLRIILITGRPQGIEPSTKQQLRRDGLRGRYTLIMKPNADRRTAAAYKSAERKKIQRRGVKILVNIGDQRSDLAGGAARKRFKVPNPMYFTP